MQWNPIFSITAFMTKKTKSHKRHKLPLCALCSLSFDSYSILVFLISLMTAMPSTPKLGQPECSSRECIIHVKQSVRTQHLEIQYRADAQPWTSYPDSVRCINCTDGYKRFRDFQKDVARDIAERLKTDSHCRICWFKAKGRYECQIDVRRSELTSLKNKLKFDLSRSIRCS